MIEQPETNKRDSAEDRSRRIRQKRDGWNAKDIPDRNAVDPAARDTFTKLSDLVQTVVAGPPGVFETPSHPYDGRPALPAPPVDGPMPRRSIERPSEQEHVCIDCGNAYSAETTPNTHPAYWNLPYNYSKGSARRCLACWLGVGLWDIVNLNAEGSAEWLREIRAELGLSASDLADILGVVPRTVTNWEKNGLPAHGTAPRLVTGKLKSMIEDRRANRETR